MEIPIADGRYRAALLAVSILIAAIVCIQAGELWLADRWLASGNLALVERGAALVPSNGSAWDKLGHLRQWNLSNPDLPGAIADYQKALRVDPRAAHYWMDLASAYEASGNDAGAADAYVHAQSVYPDSAEVAFYAGNFLLRLGKYPEAFAELRRAVRTDSSILPMAISRAWHATGDAKQIVEDLLPANVNAYVQAIDYFASIHQTAAALAVWTRLADSQSAVPLRSTFPLFDELISEDRSADARRIWPQALAAASISQQQAAGDSLIWNGDFANDFAGGGLGWRWTGLPGVYLSFESAPAQTAGRALQLDFNDGSNVNLTEPSEYIPVDPGRSYHFHALMRTDAITTESGTRFSVSDPNHPGAVNVLTENFTGTRGWTPVDADLTTGPDTHFLVLRLTRQPSRLFDNKVGGTVWIAGLSLVPAQAESEPHP
jgi:tetratricopeptide (TPR) repeat protein